MCFYFIKIREAVMEKRVAVIPATTKLGTTKRLKESLLMLLPL